MAVVIRQARNKLLFRSRFPNSRPHPAVNIQQRNLEAAASYALERQKLSEWKRWLSR
jgi:hypothetical protein